MVICHCKLLVHQRVPTKNGDFVHSYVSLPEAIWLVVTGTMEFVFVSMYWEE